MQAVWNLFGVGSAENYRTKSLVNENKGVLSLSGGGVRAVATLEVLQALEVALDGEKIGNYIDLTAASSAGCLLSSLLNLEDKDHLGTRKYSARDLSPIMESKVKEIFNVTWAQSISTIDGTRAPKYTSDGMNAALNDLFHETLAKDLMGDYCFTSFDTTNFKDPYHPFTKREARDNPQWQSLKVSSMLRGVTAAPTYFSPEKIGECNIIDGGIAANNPALISYGEAKLLFKDKNITLLSIGTGCVNYHLQETDWGALHWGPWIIPSLFSGADSVVRKTLKSYDDDHFKSYSVQFDLEEGKDRMDDTSDANIGYLRGVARDWIKSEEGQEIIGEVSKRLERPI